MSKSAETKVAPLRGFALPHGDLSMIVGSGTPRYAIHGIGLDSKNRRLIATNGKAMAIVPLSDDATIPDDDTVILPVDAYNHARKNRKRNPRIERSDPEYFTVFADGRDPYVVENLEGQFPEVDHIVAIANEQNVAHTVRIDAQLLLDLAEALGAQPKEGDVRGQRKIRPVKLTLPDVHGGAIRVETKDTRSDERFGLIMPLSRLES